jgi:glycosyltransferase involved in cell wall biosynthesis
MDSRAAMNLDQVAVSVAMITYNHEPFIGQAIESVLMQCTDFPFELVIGEDCSTDSTRHVVLDFQRRYPERIRLVLHPENIGMHRNVGATLGACQGNYIASIEGDDYWTTRDKLQRQLEFLETHPECSMCFHDAAIVYENGRPDSAPATYAWLGREKPPPIVTLEHLLVGCFIPTCGVMFRRKVLGEIPTWTHELTFLDWTINILLAGRGNIGFLNEVMGVYRVHSGGVWSGMDRRFQLQQLIRFYGLIGKHLGSRYSTVRNQRLGKAYLDLALDCASHHQSRDACRSLALACRHAALTGQPPLRRFLHVSAMVGRRILTGAAQA